MQGVDAHRAIERVGRVYQSGSTASFGEVVPDRVPKRKVRTFLARSAALAEHWRTPIPDDPVPDDPIPIKECLARVTLAARLSRNSFAFDPAIRAPERERDERLRSAWAAGHGADRVAADASFVVVYAPRESAADRSEDLLRVAVPPEMFREPHARARIRAGWGVRVRDPRESSVVERIVALSDAQTGVARHVVRKTGWDEWWECAGAPSARQDHAAVRTATEMVVYGGRNSAHARLDTGGRYDPVADLWGPTCTVGATRPQAHTAVSTGSCVLVWGGIGESVLVLFGTGAKYDRSRRIDDHGDEFTECAGDCDDERPELSPATFHLVSGNGPAGESDLGTDRAPIRYRAPRSGEQERAWTRCSVDRHVRSGRAGNAGHAAARWHTGIRPPRGSGPCRFGWIRWFPISRWSRSWP